MTGAGILDGDHLVVDRSVTPKHGHIVVAVCNGEMAVKRLHDPLDRIARRAGLILCADEFPRMVDKSFHLIGFRDEAASLR
jgi:hypothetical protein